MGPASTRLAQALPKICQTVTLIGPEIVISSLCSLGQPLPGIFLRAMVPSLRQVSGAEFLRMDRKRGEELVIQLHQFLRLRLTQIRDVKSVVIFPEGVPIVLPGHVVLLQPAVCLELAAGKDDVHTVHRVGLAPDVRDGLRAAASQEVLEIHLMEHPLDVGHSDLKGRVGVVAAECLVHRLRILFGNQAHAVEAGDVHVLQCLHSVKGAWLFPLPKGDDRHPLRFFTRVIDHDDAVLSVDPDAIHPRAAGKHQAIIGVELT